MKSEIRDKAINSIVKDTHTLKELLKEYYTNENPKEDDELLKSISQKRNNIDAKLELMLTSNIITIDEWTLVYRLISTLT